MLSCGAMRARVNASVSQCGPIVAPASAVGQPQQEEPNDTWLKKIGQGERAPGASRFAGQWVVVTGAPASSAAG
jgi:hypothetical protein